MARNLVGSKVACMPAERLRASGVPGISVRSLGAREYDSSSTGKYYSSGTAALEPVNTTERAQPRSRCICPAVHPGVPVISARSLGAREYDRARAASEPVYLSGRTPWPRRHIGGSRI